MLLWCPIIETLWKEVNGWLIEIGFLEYNSRKILGDLDSGPIINSSILLSKKVIYDSFRKEKHPSLVHIKMRLKTYTIWRSISIIQTEKKNALKRSGIC